MDKMEYIRIITLAIWYILLIRIVRGHDETICGNNNRDLKCRNRSATILWTPVEIRRTNCNSRIQKRLVIYRFGVAGVAPGTNSNVPLSFISGTYLNLHSEIPILISRRCLNDFWNPFTIDIIDENTVWKLSYHTAVLYGYIPHGFTLNSVSVVTLPLGTDGLRCGKELFPTFTFMVMSECIADTDNVKNKNGSATYTKDNFKNVYTVCLILCVYIVCLILCVLDLFCISEVKKHLYKQDQKSVNCRKENGKSRASLPKASMIDTSEDDSVQETEQTITGCAREGSLVNEDGNAENKSPRLREKTSDRNEIDREHGARRSSDVSNNTRTHGKKTSLAVGQPSILNEERVATNGNTVNDDEVKTNDAIDTVETVNVGIGRDVSEYLTPETTHLEVLEATKKGGAAQEDELVCKICYMDEISVVFLPCSHMLACESCSKLLERCAVCRAVIKAMLKAEIK